jgi:hypothetical protein
MGRRDGGLGSFGRWGVGDVIISTSQNVDYNVTEVAIVYRRKGYLVQPFSTSVLASQAKEQSANLL